ncbi:MAG: hypothetical protein GXP62_11970 [Oligoflexia bacterium]|nr:hypothetical protein [Oligoflexia bacterium]
MFLLLLSIACASKHVPTGVDVPYTAADLVGDWRNEGAGEITIVDQRGKPVVQSVVDYDGEVFEILGFGWGEDGYSWSYRVPSTDYHITETVLSIDGDSLHTSWSNQNGDTGKDTWSRD